MDGSLAPFGVNQERRTLAPETKTRAMLIQRIGGSPILRCTKERHPSPKTELRQGQPESLIQGRIFFACREEIEACDVEVYRYASKGVGRRTGYRNPEARGIEFEEHHSLLV